MQCDSEFTPAKTAPEDTGLSTQIAFSFTNRSPLDHHGILVNGHSGLALSAAYLSSGRVLGRMGRLCPNLSSTGQGSWAMAGEDQQSVVHDPDIQG